MNKKKPVLLIDDECVFCNKTVNFIIDKGGEGKFNFLSIHSEEGKKKINEHGLPDEYTESVVLIRENEVYLKSDAALEVSAELEGVYKTLAWFRFIPQGIRDRVYDLVAKHRHKII
jgi:predicted DCC family thiol-disulfide oxidoreductase YuxK